MDAPTKQQLYLSWQGVALITPIAAVSAVIILAGIVAIVCAAVAFSIATPLSVNAASIKELELLSKLKAVQGANPEETLRDYLTSKGNLVGVDDVAAFPPHPALQDTMMLTNKGNPWNIPSDTRERILRHSGDATEITSFHVPQHQRARIHAATEERMNDYRNAVIGKKVKDRMFKLRKRVNPSEEKWFHSVFGTHHASVDLGGHCSRPVPAVEGKTCAQTCFSSFAVRVKTPFIAGGVFISHDIDSSTPSEYCWSGGIETKKVEDVVDEFSPRNGEKLRRMCSAHTAVLVLTDDGGWQCRPKFPTYFGGSDGTQMASCAFNSSSHKGPAAEYDTNKSYVDAVSQRRILNHESFSKCVYLRLLRSAKSVANFKKIASDPDLLFRFPVTCQCSGKRDVLNNTLLEEKITKKMKFRGLYECLENPCVMVPDISPDFFSFNPTKGTCNAKKSPKNTVHAILGDNRTPLVGEVPAMGLILADLGKRGDKIHTQRAEVAYDEQTAKEITRAAAPVVTASNIDSSNPSRNVLFVPVPSMVLPPTTANLPRVTMRPSSIMHKSCLPPILNKEMNQYRPFCTAPFYVEPAANVLAGHVPQKPYEHNLLVTECLRNSRMVSGSIHGGSEILFSTLLSRDSPLHEEGDPRRTTTPGDDRLEEIRSYYDSNFGQKRRLSNTEYLMRKRNSLPARLLFDGISRWDSEFKRTDFDKMGIENVAESFVLKEGLLIRSYGPYAATVLAPALFNLDILKGYPAAKTASALKPFNPLQFAFPTSYSVLPEEMSNSDIFSVDSRRLFDSNTIARYFDATKAINYTTDAAGVAKLFSDDVSSSMSHYRVDTKDDAWGLQTFRLDYNPKKGPAIVSDPRLEFDHANIDVTPRGATLTPLSLFKKTPLEWGHREADVQKSNWFKDGIDTSTAYRRLLVETSMAVRNMWFSLTWEDKNYYFVKNSN